MGLSNIIDLSRLKKILDFISDSMKMGICFTDSTISEVLYHSDKHNICSDSKILEEIKNSPRFNSLKQETYNKNNHFLTCSGNMTVIPFPVKNRNTLLGWIIFGPVILSDTEYTEDLSAPDLGSTAITDTLKLEQDIKRVIPVISVITDLIYEKYLISIEKNSIKYHLRKQLQTEKKLLQANSELQTIFTNSQVGIMYLKGGRYFMKGNQRLADILGWENPEEMAGISMRKLHISEETFNDFGENFFNNLAHGKRIHIEYQLARKDKTPVWCMLSGKAVDENDPADLDKGVIWIIEDISRIKEAEEQLKKLAQTDHLTSLINRSGFHKHLEREIQRSLRNKSPLSLLLIDLDYFKKINDTYGHDAGDAVLVHFGSLMKKYFRNIDIPSRIGGEEFAVIMPDTSLYSGIEAAERLRSVLEKNITLFNGSSIGYTASMGLCEYSGESLKEFYSRTDNVMYRAKREGRNRICI